MRQRQLPTGTVLQIMRNGSGPVHLAIEGRLPDLSTIMNEEKRRQMLHRGVMSTTGGATLLLILKAVMLASGFFLGLSLSPSIVLLLIFLSVPFLAYGIGSLISGMFVYSRKALDYTQRFDVVREMLDSRQEGSLPSVGSFPLSITERTTTELLEPISRDPKPERS